MTDPRLETLLILDGLAAHVETYVHCFGIIISKKMKNKKNRLKIFCIKLASTLGI